ncbi:MAG: hypothetical protein BWY98_00231 [Tenericutes bacterium ADurb.BinA155]|nr:MAG: hypothetical protein BWY98_00231 [Tenericutes bacterium ADurb.BinA155]
MALTIQERLFSWTEQYDVNDEEGRPLYHVHGEFWSLGHKIHIDDLEGKEVAFIKEKVWSFFHTYEIYIAGELKGTIKEKFSWFHAKFKVDFMDCLIKGDILDWNYEVLKQDGTSIGLVQRKVLSLHNTFYLTATDPKDELPLLALALAVDASHHDDETGEAMAIGASSYYW